MHRLIPILIACLALLSGCARPLVDTRITDADLVSLSPTGLRTADATVRLTVSNPGPAFTLRDIHGTVKLSGDPLLNLTTDDVTVDRHRDSTYVMSLHGELDGSVSVLQFLLTPHEWNPDELTVDLSARVGLGSSSGKTLEYKDIPLRNLIQNF